MGKSTRKKKKLEHEQPGSANSKPSKSCDRISKAFDVDTTIFINMSQELKEEGKKLFQKRDHEGAMSKYDKALKLLPKTHIDVAHLHSNMAACYMQMGLGEYPRAINEFNLALEVSPRYSKALLERAKCYEALNRLDLAYKDINVLLNMDPNNLYALKILKKVKKVMSKKGISIDEKEIGVAILEQAGSSSLLNMARDETLNNCKKFEDEAAVKVAAENKAHFFKDNQVTTKTIVEEVKVPIRLIKEEKAVTKSVKFVMGEDIRWAQLPTNCSMKLVREIVQDRFPGIEGVLVKYRDQDGDLITITTTDELRLAESLYDPKGSIKLYIAKANPDQEPIYDKISDDELKDSRESSNGFENGDIGKSKEVENGVTCVEDWILQFGRLFKNHVGFDSDSYLDLHELGLKLHSEATKDTVTSDDAQALLHIAADKFQEMTALALYNWGNVHMSKARKQVTFPEDASKDQIVEQFKVTYNWAKKEYIKAEKRYEEALKIKPDFYEGFLALGRQHFEQAKLCWHYSVGNNVEIGTEPSSNVLQLYDKAEDSMEKGMLMWKEMEELRLNELSKADKCKGLLKTMGLEGLIKDIAPDVAAEQAANMKSQIYLLWGTLLYERSVVEYKLGLPTWEECLEVSVEKFELAGASSTDIAVMIKNHCSNENALEGLGFKIDEIVQAWNEMYDAQRWQFGVSSFRLEPLFRRRVPKLHSLLEHV